MKVAITGTGFMGVTHAEALARLPEVEVIGIQGSSPAKSRAAADRLSLPRAYESYEALLDDPDVESVHITTPNRLHFEQAVAALDAGKHVLCEKPLAMRSTESAELVERAEASGKATAVNYNIRFYPLNLDAAARIAAGELGPVHSVTGSYQQDWLLYDTDYNWRVLAEEGGALRAVADIGTHWLDLVQFLTGLRLEAVLADLGTLHPTRRRPKGEVQTFAGKLGSEEATEEIPIATEDFASILLRFEGGGRGTLFVSQVTPGLKNSLRYELAGSRAALRWNSETPNQAWIGHREQGNLLLTRDPSLMHPAAQALTDYPGGHAEGFPDTFKMAFRSFYRFIAEGGSGAQPPFATFQDGHRELLACEAILRSHQTQTWTALNP